jgi:hypothetical protein
MKRLFTFFGLALWSAITISAGGPYLSVEAGAERNTLAITTKSGVIQAPSTEEDQQSFSNPAVSQDGRTVGWLAEVGNCCTSYPLPLALVIFKGGKVAYRFHETTAIWRWSFLAGGSEVGYQWTWPHGFVPTYYVRRSLKTGAVLSEFVCEIDDVKGEYIVPKDVPAWVHKVVEGNPC